jgi:hypothetical protein
MSGERCGRCGLPAPPVEASDYVFWEAIGEDGVICPGCLTGQEEQAMDDQVMAFRERCSRCQREAPSATRKPGETTSARVAEGWLSFESDAGALIETVCPGCMTDEDRVSDDAIYRGLGLSTGADR